MAPRNSAVPYGTPLVSVSIPGIPLRPAQHAQHRRMLRAPVRCMPGYFQARLTALWTRAQEKGMSVPPIITRSEHQETRTRKQDLTIRLLANSNFELSLRPGPDMPKSTFRLLHRYEPHESSAIQVAIHV